MENIMNIPEGYVLLPREVFDDLMRRATPLQTATVPTVTQPTYWHPNTCGWPLTSTSNTRGEA